MDWTAWNPREIATLCFVVEADRILLIMKKRGLGAGKYNAPGGKVEPGETPLQCALRETREEIGVDPVNARQVGELYFEFTDGYSLHCHVFRADSTIGTLIETDEATPFWAPLDAIPYDGMWADDRHWLPLLVGGNTFRGWFEFDGETMLSKKLSMVNLEDFQQPLSGSWRAF